MEYLRRCIRYKAEESPNVQLALLQRRLGQRVTNETLVPGMVGWLAYVDGRRNLPKSRQQVVLDADWYEGAEERLVPDEWLQFAHGYEDRRPAWQGRRWLGVDSGEGGDDSAWVVIDRHGVLAVVSLKTPDTNSVYGRTCLIVREHGIAWEDVIFDYGGGGKEHVDRFRAGGFPVRGLRFGAIKKELKRSMTQFTEKVEVEAEASAYQNRRSEMAYELRMLLERAVPLEEQDFSNVDPEVVKAVVGSSRKLPEKEPFALPMPLCEELCRQIACVPLQWDAMGRFLLIPKSPPKGSPEDMNNFRAKIGRSPDQFDAFCLAVWGMRHPPKRAQAGVS